MREVLCFYIPCANRSKAEHLVQVLIQEGLIACGNIIGANSHYIWEGAINEDAESIVIAKTLPHLENKLESAIEKLHDYDVPCIARWNIRVNDAYFSWMCEVIKS